MSKNGEMSDESNPRPAEEPEEAEEAEKPGDVADSESRIQRKDGSWEKVEHKPISNDPDVEAMGKLRWKDLQAIVDDPEHPQHEQATEYARLLGERMRKFYSTSLPDLSQLTKQYEKIFRDITLAAKLPSIKFPKWDPSSLELTPTLPPSAKRPPSRPDESRARVESPSEDTHELPEELAESTDQRDVDTGVDAIRMVALLQEILESLSELNVKQSKQSDDSAVMAGLQAHRVSQEEERAKEEGKRAEGAEKRARHSFWTAVLAILATAGVGIIQICQNAELFWSGH